TLKAENEELKKKIQELENKEIFVDAAEESVEELKAKIKDLEKQLAASQVELDKANESRLKALKDFDKKQEKVQQLEKDLESTSEYGSEQIVKLEKINRDLKHDKGLLAEQLKLTEQDLDSYQRINELRLGKKEVSDG
ncbi:15154_t:CDS:1, partial [Cetraspora pellucida]